MEITATVINIKLNLAVIEFVAFCYIKKKKTVIHTNIPDQIFGFCLMVLEP